MPVFSSLQHIGPGTLLPETTEPAPEGLPKGTSRVKRQNFPPWSGTNAPSLKRSCLLVLLPSYNVFVSDALAIEPDNTTNSPPDSCALADVPTSVNTKTGCSFVTPSP